MMTVCRSCRRSSQRGSLLEKDAALAGSSSTIPAVVPAAMLDCMIAAHAIRREAVLATLNRRDFRVFEDSTCSSWMRDEFA